MDAKTIANRSYRKRLDSAHGLVAGCVQERPRQSPEQLAPRASPPPQPTMMQAATERLQASIAELLSLKDRLSATCDRLLGPVPAGTQAVGATGDIPCDMERLHTSLDLLESGLCELRSQVERVERL